MRWQCVWWWLCVGGCSCTTGRVVSSTSYGRTCHFQMYLGPSLGVWKPLLLPSSRSTGWSRSDEENLQLPNYRTCQPNTKSLHTCGELDPCNPKPLWHDVILFLLNSTLWWYTTMNGSAPITCRPQLYRKPRTVLYSIFIFLSSSDVMCILSTQFLPTVLVRLMIFVQVACSFCSLMEIRKNCLLPGGVRSHWLLACPVEVTSWPWHTTERRYLLMLRAMLPVTSLWSGMNSHLPLVSIAIYCTCTHTVNSFSWYKTIPLNTWWFCLNSLHLVAAYHRPYLIALLAKAIEVKTTEPPSTIQILTLDKPRLITVSASTR